MARKNLIELPIIWEMGDDIVTRYATDLAVQYNEHECILMFFESNPPLLLGEQADITELLKNDTEGSIHVTNKCIAKLAVSRGRMKSFIELLIRNFEISEQAINEQIEEDQE